MQYIKYLAIPIILGIIIISCEKDDTSVIDPILHIPSISNATFTPVNFDSDTINAVATVEVNSVDPIKQVTVTLINPLSEGEQAFILRDDGVAPDLTAGDGIYSARVIYSRTCRLVGGWGADFIAETDAGLLSNTEHRNFTVINSNSQRPLLSNLIAPDSLRRATGNGGDTLTVITFLQVKVTDSDGDCDDREAYFNSFSPSGFPNQFNPFAMYDDGNIAIHGDSVAGDNKYSLIVQIPPNPSDSAIGNFTFKFNAKDRSLVVSDTLTKIITLHR